MQRHNDLSRRGVGHRQAFVSPLSHKTGIAFMNAIEASDGDAPNQLSTDLCIGIASTDLCVSISS